MSTQNMCFCAEILHKNICYGYSLEAPRRGASNEYPKHVFLCRDKKNLHTFWLKKKCLVWCYVLKVEWDAIY